MKQTLSAPIVIQKTRRPAAYWLGRALLYAVLLCGVIVLCAPLATAGGISAAQRARADLQRGWKGQPAGMLARDGTEPGMVGRRSRPRERALGAACSNPCV